MKNIRQGMWKAFEDLRQEALVSGSDLGETSGRAEAETGWANWTSRRTSSEGIQYGTRTPCRRVEGCAGYSRVVGSRPEERLPARPHTSDRRCQPNSLPLNPLAGCGLSPEEQATVPTMSDRQATGQKGCPVQGRR